MEKTKQQITIPMAIIAAGFLIMFGIIISGSINLTDKTFSEQLGINKDKLSQCISNMDQEKLGTEISASVESAMKGLSSEEMGTPYSIVIGKNGFKSQINGNASIENIMSIIDEVKRGEITKEYLGDVPPVTETDHIMGNKDAEIIIIEYSDYECPFCKSIHSTLETVVKESNGNVAWVFRHWPIHQTSFLKVMAAECVTEIKGNEAFWEYTDLLFGMLKTQTETVLEKL